MADESVTVPANLMPAAAPELRDRLVAAVKAASAEGTALAVEMDDGALLPCTTQILVAMRSFAADQGVTLTVGPRATELLDSLDSAGHAA